MRELIEAILTNGVISYVNPIEAEPERRETRDGVNYITGEVQGVPGHFEVEFKVAAEFKINDLRASPYISISVPVSIESKNTTVRAIEREAVPNVAPMLREIADAIDRQIAAIPKADDSPATDTPDN